MRAPTLFVTHYSELVTVLPKPLPCPCYQRCFSLHRIRLIYSQLIRKDHIVCQVQLAKIYPNCQNLHLGVEQRQDGLHFLHRVQKVVSMMSP
jgi:DNA mismatch repair ATPase MutS